MTSPAHWREVKDAFDRLRDLDPEVAALEIARLAAEDPAVAAEVRSLLDAHRHAASFLETPAVFACDVPVDPLVGLCLGAYRITREVSRGGMGVVYAAERVDGEYQQAVAIKVLRAGLTDSGLVERFRSERRILAALDHPSIARILDAGTLDDRRPYLVMEFVDGVPIDVYCRDASLSLVGKARLLADVAEAVHHAHQHLVVHRDIKPTNVLVTADGRPKLLDFGIAKLLDDTAAEGVATVDVLPMTPRYASPEQVRGEAVSTATDVYSLGVLLYELVAGCGPYRLSTTSAAELQAAVRDQEPAPPSAVATTDRRSVGDLDTIVLKALHKLPARRYASALALAEDLERYLDGRPVLARPDSTWYRARRFVARHRTAVALTGLALATLVVALGVTVWQYRSAERQRRLAEQRFDDVRQLANTFLFGVHDAIADLPGSTLARERIVATATTYLDRLSADAGENAGLTRELAAAYERLSQIQGQPGTANLGDASSALRSQRRAVSLREARSRLVPADAEARLEWSASLASLSMLDSDDSASLSAAKAAVAIVEATTDRPDTVSTRLAEAAAYYALASALVDRREVEGAITAFSRNAAALEVVIKAHPDDRTAERSLAVTSKRLGAILGSNGRVDEALGHYRRALGIERARVAEGRPTLQGSRDLSVTYSDLGWLSRLKKDQAAVLNYYSRALEIRRGLVKADPANLDISWLLSSTLLNLAIAENDQQARSEARRLIDEAIAIREAIVSRHPQGHVQGLGDAYWTRADLAKDEGRFASALTDYQRAEALYLRPEVATRTRRSARLSLAQLGGQIGSLYRQQAERSGQAGERCRLLALADGRLAPAAETAESVMAEGELLAVERTTALEIVSQRQAVSAALQGLRSRGTCAISSPQ